MGRNPADESSPEPQVSVIIVNHNRAELLLECLQSVVAQTYRNLEILIVDNGSSDHSDQAAKSFADARINWIPLEKNLGFAGGCNVGIRRARGEFVALLNNDAVAGEDWIEQLMVPLLDDPDTGMCASKILFHGEDVIDKVGHLIYLDGQNRGRGTGERDTGQYDRREETLFPDGCAALYRRELMEQVGGFDEEFFAYGDDADLGIRIRLLGSRCQYVPEAIVYHRHSSTLGSYSPQKIFWVVDAGELLATEDFLGREESVLAGYEKFSLRTPGLQSFFHGSQVGLERSCISRRSWSRRELSEEGVVQWFGWCCLPRLPGWTGRSPPDVKEEECSPQHEASVRH
jgi:GT2 family glycosyltransferase